MKKDLIEEGHKAKVGAWKSGSEATEARIATSASEGDTSEGKAEQFLMERQEEKAGIEENMKEIARAAKHGIENSQNANAIRKRLQEEEKAQLAAVPAETKKELAKRFKAQHRALDEWRDKVLVDPNVRAASISDKGYNKLVRTLYGRYHEYMLNAGAMQGQADSMASAGAGKIASGEAKIKAGGAAKIVGEQELAEGNALVASSGVAAGQAGTYKSQAQAVMNDISQALAHSAAAHWTAMGKNNPYGSPPAPFNPDTSYVEP